MIWPFKREPAEPEALQLDATLANAMALHQVKWVDKKNGVIAVHGYVWQVKKDKKGWIVNMETYRKGQISDTAGMFLAAYLGQSESVVSH